MLPLAPPVPSPPHLVQLLLCTSVFFCVCVRACVCCAGSCIYRRCFLLLFICSHATWVISQLVHSPPPSEASSILMLELPVLTCQCCSCKLCQILPYCYSMPACSSHLVSGFSLVLFLFRDICWRAILRCSSLWRNMWLESPVIQKQT